ncbi:hypothetical protein D9757_010225 [Collybiopsis confluens]|uniref:Uncharacterized protein n=1 Tax=Collybiopsis confluens TaxID=2823264 RepID=A0A8H5GPE3_9AGAR|nr:hypothetical protein D9757_010225 [Collybiopsis confluens]
MLTPYTVNPWRFLLQTYLRNALCPAPTSAGVHLRDREKEGNWRCFNLEEALNPSKDNIDDTPDIFITEDDKPHMSIPCYGVNTVNPGQVDFLSRVNDHNQFMLLIMKFILGPIMECCRMINNIPRNAPMAHSLQFIATRGPDDPLLVDYDVLRIPSTSSGSGPLNIICVPPWKLDYEDFRAFTLPSVVPEHQQKMNPLYRPTSAEATANANDLWRIVSSACSSVPSGPCFVVTNYMFWCFGRFEGHLFGTGNENAGKGKGKAKAVDLDMRGWTTAVVSPPIELEMSVPNAVRLPMLTSPMGLGCTVPECLLFWIQMARGVAPWMEYVDRSSSEAENGMDDDSSH